MAAAAEPVRAAISDVSTSEVADEELVARVRDGDREAFEAIRSSNPSVPVILCSGYSEEEFLSRFAGKGFAAFMHKPYRLAELVAALKRALGRGERQGE